MTNTLSLNFFRLSDKNRKREGGYTMIEMLTILGIIVILMGLVLANTRFGNKQQQLRDSVDEYITTVKEAQAYAGSVKKSPNYLAPNDSAQNKPYKSYGVCLTTDSSSTAAPCRTSGVLKAVAYQLYARDDCLPLTGCPQPCVAPGSCDPANIDPSTREPFQLLKTHKLPTNFEIRVAPGVPACTQPMAVDFLPPNPTMFINGLNGPGCNLNFATSPTDTLTEVKGLSLVSDAGVVYGP